MSVVISLVMFLHFQHQIHTKDVVGKSFSDDVMTCLEETIYYHT